MERAMSRVIVDHPAEHVVQVTINRPEAKNAIDEDTRHALIDSLGEVLADERNRALLLRGADGMFCAGGDLVSMRGMTEAQALARMQNGHELVSLVWNADIPVVAAVEKYAVGAGAGLALLSDYIVAGETAFMSFPFLQLGLVPDWASTQMLIRRTGWGRTRQLILNKARPRGEDLLRLGIADEIVSDADVVDTALAKATELALFPRLAFRLFKRRMRAFPEDFDDALSAEAKDQADCFVSDEFDEGLSAVMEKRAADFVSVAKSSRKETP